MSMENIFLKGFIFSKIKKKVGKFAESKEERMRGETEKGRIYLLNLYILPEISKRTLI